MADEPKFKTKSLVNNSPKRYGRNSWIGLGVVLSLGAVAYAAERHQNSQAQFNAYEAAQRNAEYARTVEDPDRAIKVWRDSIRSLRKVDPGHPKHESAQELMVAYEQEIDSVREEVETLKAEEDAKSRAAAQDAVDAYNTFLKTFEPSGLTVSSIALDPNIDSQIIVTVGSAWGAASKTARLDLADSLWKGWGRVCDCSVPRIKFKSQAGRDLGGTGTFGTAIELKD